MKKNMSILYYIQATTKLSIEDFSWGMEDGTSTLDTQETAQQQLVYITNLEKDLQKHSTEMNKEEGPKEKSLQQKIGLLKGPP